MMSFLKPYEEGNTALFGIARSFVGNQDHHVRVYARGKRGWRTVISSDSAPNLSAFVDSAHAPKIIDDPFEQVRLLNTPEISLRLARDWDKLERYVRP